MENLQYLVEVAAGRKPADLVFKNADVVNVFTAEILRADVAVAGGIIAGVGQYSGLQEVDCTGKTLCPGFIDAHLHIESTMVLPRELVRLTLPSGTTTMIADPHEIVNVCGSGGVQFMLDSTSNLPCNMYIMLPSSVPTTEFETAGASFTAQEMQQFLDNPRVLGLGEAMCFPDVVAGRGAIFDKLDLFEGRMVDGHAPGLTGRELQAYAAAGVGTEHECTTFEEALEKVRAGFGVLVREGSAAHNLAAIVGGLVETGLPSHRFMFCTDDKHLDDIGRDGHIRWNVKLAIELGMKPAEAICMASWNTARLYGLRGIGAIAPGYRADIVVLSHLKSVEVEAVYKDGLPAARLLENMPSGEILPAYVLDTVKNAPVQAEDFALRVEGPAHVIEMVPYQLMTNHLVEPVPCNGGFFAPDATYTKLCVVERHGKNGNIAVAPLKGYGLRGGALATTVAHDSHNIIAAGDNDADIALAVNRLREIGGGYVLVQNGRLAGEVPLQVAGLMSTAAAHDVEQGIHSIIHKAYAMGIPYYIDPFISLSFLALPVIPAVRLTDKGLFDVDKFSIIKR